MNLEKLCGFLWYLSVRRTFENTGDGLHQGHWPVAQNGCRSPPHCISHEVMLPCEQQDKWGDYSAMVNALGSLPPNTTVYLTHQQCNVLITPVPMTNFSVEVVSNHR